MSPPPPIDPESFPKELKDGVIASILGGLAMTARLLLSTEPVSVGWVVRRVLAAAITAALVGYGIQDHIESPGLKMAVVGAAGYAAPECLDYLMRYIKSKGDAEVGPAPASPMQKTKPRESGASNLLLAVCLLTAFAGLSALASAYISGVCPRHPAISGRPGHDRDGRRHQVGLGQRRAGSLSCDPCAEGRP